MPNIDEIRELLLSRYLTGSPDLQNDESLVESGRLDSISLLNLIACLEEQYSISIATEEITLANFDTVSAITALLVSKLSA